MLKKKHSASKGEHFLNPQSRLLHVHTPSPALLCTCVHSQMYLQATSARCMFHQSDKKFSRRVQMGQTGANVQAHMRSFNFRN